MAKRRTVSYEEARERQIIRQRLWRQQNPEKVKQQALARNMRKKKLRELQASKLEDKSAITINEQQLLYLSKNRSQTRSVLAKNLGVTKQELFYLLEKYGGGIKC